MRTTLVRIAVFAIGCAGVGGCATGGAGLVGSPEVHLEDVEISNFDVRTQTFVLNFGIRNPNPFALEISSIRYGVRLDGQRFASGETACSVSVPAQSDGRFAITVDLNLLKTAPDLLFVVRDGVRKPVSYSLDGRFEIDMPASPHVSFENSGNIRLQAALQ